VNANVLRLLIKCLGKRFVGSDFCLLSRVSAHNASAPNIYRDWLNSQSVLWQSAYCHSAVSEYISGTLIPAQSKQSGLDPKIHPVRVSLGKGAERDHRLNASV